MFNIEDTIHDLLFPGSFSSLINLREEYIPSGTEAFVGAVAVFLYHEGMFDSFIENLVSEDKKSDADAFVEKMVLIEKNAEFEKIRKGRGN